MREPRPGERVIILGARQQHQTIVSEEDFAFLVQWRWTFKVSSWKYGRKVYARRCIRVDGQKRTLMMHDVILERAGKPRPSDLHTANHRNRDSLDNTRGNLEWATHSEQCTHGPGRGRRTRAELQAEAA